MQKSSNKFAKTKLVFFDINFEENFFHSVENDNDDFLNQVKLLKTASKTQILVIFTNNFLHDVIKFCKKNKINSGYIVASNKTIIYSLQSKKYLHVSCLNDRNIDFILHLGFIYSANFLVYTTTNKIIYQNSLIEDLDSYKGSKTTICKNMRFFKKTLKNKKISNIFLKFHDGFKITEMFLELKKYYNKNENYFSSSCNENIHVDISNKNIIIFQNQNAIVDIISKIISDCHITATNSRLYYPINNFDVHLYLQCKHHVLNDHLYKPQKPTNNNHVFCVNKTKKDLNLDFGASTNSFWKSEK